jgi:2-oxoglutarate dehydrogenase E1 component
VHVVVNNQIGFTTLPEDARSSMYCTDVAKIIEAPVLHVNGEDPEAVVAAAKIAMEFRQEFKKDVFIDLQCYRKYGHNEQDETSFTQPILAGMIKKKKSVLEQYQQRLLDEGVINQADIQAIKLRMDEALERAQHKVKSNPHDPTIDPGSSRWAGQSHSTRSSPRRPRCRWRRSRRSAPGSGGCPRGSMSTASSSRCSSRGRADDPGEISYADAEHLAYGTLLLEGHAIRISGQDCRRGTFSHRHAVLRDAETGEPYTPLNNIREVGRSAPRWRRARSGRRQAPPGQAVRLRQPAERGVGARVRLRLLARRPEHAGDLGGAVRRLRERRAGASSTSSSPRPR